jgi:hypothetical protein
MTGHTMKTCWAVIVSTLLTLFALPLHAMEPAVRADDMIESIGVCTHWLYHDTPYGKEFPKAKKLLKELGVRYIRDRFSERNAEIYQELGIKTTAIVMPEMEKYLSLMRKYPQAVAAIEGPNESNLWQINYKDQKGFPNATRLFQNDLYQTVINDPVLKNIPVISTSTAYMGNNTALSPLNSFDYAVIHSYPNGRSPSSLQRTLDNAQKLLATGEVARPVIATEAGYHTAYGMGSRESQGTTDQARAKLIPRLLTEYFKQGVVRTHIYEFICTHEHQNSSGKRAEAKFGLLTYYMAPTAAYTAMKNFITILNDTDANFSPKALDFSIDAPVDSIHRMLIQKGDGTYYLLLWNDLEVYNQDVLHPDYGKDIFNPDVAVTVNLPDMPMQQIQCYRPTQSDKPLMVMQPSQQLYLNVPDDMLIVRFKLPQNKVQPVASPQKITATASTTEVNLSWEKPEKSPEIKGYFVTCMGKTLGFTTQTQFNDTVTLPGLGYTYTVQSVDLMGNTSKPAQHVVMTPVAFPDVIVTNVTMMPEHPKAGDHVSFKATIKNIGKYASPAITHGIAFRIDKRIACWADSYKTPLEPGQEITLTANSGPGGNKHWLATQGKHQLTAHVDDQDRFREDDETNNILTIPIEIE